MPAESTAPPRAKRETLRERLVAGGTAIAEPDSGGFPWLFAGIGAAAAIAAVTWFVVSGGSAAAPTTNASETPAAAPSVVADRSGSAAPTEVEPPPAPVIDPRPRQRSMAVTALGQALAKEQLWAQVSESGDTVVIRSAFCKDAALTARLAAVRANLASLGFAAVNCLEQSGAVVFKESL